MSQRCISGREPRWMPGGASVSVAAPMGGQARREPQWKAGGASLSVTATKGDQA